MHTKAIFIMTFMNTKNMESFHISTEQYNSKLNKKF